jgi:hypothetical protein
MMKPVLIPLMTSLSQDGKFQFAMLILAFALLCFAVGYAPQIKTLLFRILRKPHVH